MNSLTLELVDATAAAAQQPISAVEIAERSGLNRRRVQRAVALLTGVQAVDTVTDGTVQAFGERVASAVDRAVRIVEQRKAFESSRLQMMRGSAETTDCRRTVLLSYFGEAVPGCVGTATTAPTAPRPTCRPTSRPRSPSAIT